MSTIRPEVSGRKAGKAGAPAIDRFDTDQRDAWSIEEFCLRHSISRSSYYNLKWADKGPKETRIGRRIVITREAAAAWLRRQERQS